MDATTLLGTLLGGLLDGAAHVAGSAAGWPSPAQLVAGSLTAGSRVLLVAATAAWIVGVLAVLVAASGRGGAGAPARGVARPVPPLPPRRVRAVVPEPAPAETPALAPVAVVAVQTPEQAPEQTPEQAPVVTPVVAQAVAAPAPAPVAVPVAVVAAAPQAGAALLRAGSALPGAPLPSRPHGAARTAATGSRCRRCTQPRCWPSTGQRHPARVLGTSAPRACRTSLTAGTTHRCGAADPWCGSDRCTTSTRAHPARPAPGSERTPALPR